MSIPLELRGVVKNFKEKRVLFGATLRVEAGSVLGLVGVNGAGKTTLLKCALGLLRPTEGEAFVLGENAWGMPATVKERIGYVPQDMKLIDYMSVDQLIAYTGSFYERWNKGLVERLKGELGIDGKASAGVLSGGEKQKVAILLALGHEPELVVLDEPAAALDPLARRTFLRLVVELAEPGKRTVVFSTHILSDLERVADRVAVLQHGKIAYEGLLENLKEQQGVGLEEIFLGMHKGNASIS
ncbi:MAG: ABC transporter ATP-binding protein [Phycisphaerales bacterium]|nr:ABC transporter ATP-binding protein [Phycisphaerales bacterium]